MTTAGQTHVEGDCRRCGDHLQIRVTVGSGEHTGTPNPAAVTQPQSMHGQPGHQTGRGEVAAARQMMIIRGLDLGLFTCDRTLQAFYESAGWHLLPGTVLIGGRRLPRSPAISPALTRSLWGTSSRPRPGGSKRRFITPASSCIRGRSTSSGEPAMSPVGCRTQDHCR